ncbi:HK97 family phage prohead protease [Coralliovum pocilloporae]|uniref:HK97 family phage prohead protease n=1 Tax=Coralliovum pocilloporae TaxID=3066369 RepID=UPI00330723CB
MADISGAPAIEWHAALDREVKFSVADLTSVEADGCFSGYASLFGKTDLGRDMVMPGAFANSLARRGTRGVKMLYQHDPSEPIGQWLELKENSRGLFVRGRLMPDVARSRDVLSLMREGVLDGLSIGFRTVRGKTDAKSRIRRLYEVDLWEISVVTFPMLPDARISAVKSGGAPGQRPTLREFERWLTRDAGFSRSDARTIIRSGFTSLKGMQDAAGDKGLARRMRQAAHHFRTART